MAFAWCTGLTSLTLPSSIVEIDEQAFRCCSALTEIIIPDSVKMIGKEAFNGCIALSRIEIPQGVKIWPHAFYGCTGLKEIKLAEIDPIKMEAPLFISGLHTLSDITLFVPAGAEIAYRHNKFFAQFKEVLPY